MCEVRLHELPSSFPLILKKCGRNYFPCGAALLKHFLQRFKALVCTVRTLTHERPEKQRGPPSGDIFKVAGP